jgi:tetratricopeptide (TPR) repeat protein
MSLYDDFLADAHQAYAAGQKRDAALLYARAKEAARELGNHAKAWQSGIWEAISFELAGEVRKAFGLIFKLLSDMPDDVPPYEAWLAHLQAFQLWCELGHRSHRDRLKHLERLEDYAATHPGVPKSDLPGVWADCLSYVGDWSEVLRYLEDAWTNYDGNGYLKCGIADSAVFAALQQNRLEEARRWLVLLSQTEQDLAAGRYYYNRSRAYIALFEHAGNAELDSLLENLNEDIRGIQARRHIGRYLMARLWLLSRVNEDPEDPFHPARTILCERHGDQRDWDRLRVVIDYRLASIRHSLKMSPCEDFFYRIPQEISSGPPMIDEIDLQRRIHRACVALARLKRTAETLDALNETDCYSREVRERQDRLSEMIESAKLNTI